MNIVFDMDNTLVDEFGASARPGVIDLLVHLKRTGHTLILWTNSRKERARQIILDNNFRRYFTTFIFREDYDPEEKGLSKDIRKVKGDILVDDDPAEIRYVATLGKHGYLVASYRKGMTVDRNEFAGLLKMLR